MGHGKRRLPLCSLTDTYWHHHRINRRPILSPGSGIIVLQYAKTTGSAEWHCARLKAPSPLAYLIAYVSLFLPCLTRRIGELLLLPLYANPSAVSFAAHLY